MHEHQGPWAERFSEVVYWDAVHAARRQGREETSVAGSSDVEAEGPSKPLWTLTKDGHSLQAVMLDLNPYGAELTVLVDQVPDARSRQPSLGAALYLAERGRVLLERKGWRES